MANFFQSARNAFGGRSKSSNTRPSAGVQSIGYGASMPGLNTQQLVSNIVDNSANETQSSEQPKFFFQEKYAKLGVKGNFMPLAAQPKNVDLAEWLAHQCAEQWVLLDKIIACIQEVDVKTGRALCNPTSCPVMSAGRSHTYTWLNHEKQPVKVPAMQYIALVQRWIVGKLSDERVFPTGTVPLSTDTSDGTAPTPTPGHNWLGKTTGYQENFGSDVKTIFRQMFRVYAHIYHSHWIDPFWHIGSTNPPSNGWTDLNSCFVHFMSVAMLFGLISEKDMEPMRPLIDIWVTNGSIPKAAAIGECNISAPPPPQAATAAAAPSSEK